MSAPTTRPAEQSATAPNGGHPRLPPRNQHRRPAPRSRNVLRRTNSPVHRPSSGHSRNSTSTSSSAFPAVPCYRSTTRFSTRRSCVTCWSATSRAPATPRADTRTPPARSACAWRRRVRVPPIWSRRWPMHTWIRSRWWLITGQVGRGADRHRRIPGSRHLRHHDADHQAQLPGPRRRRHRASDGRGVPHRVIRPAGSGARRHPEGRSAGPVHVQLAAAVRAARLQAEHQAAQPAGS